METIRLYILEGLKIAYKPQDNTIYVGQVYKSLSTIALPSNLPCEAEWWSSDESIAKVEYDDFRHQTTLTGVSEGSVWIGAESLDPVNSATDGFWLTVVYYFGDDHGDIFGESTYLGDVYFEDKTISGHLGTAKDIDCFYFVSYRNCVMEIYSQGNTDTYANLYDEATKWLMSDDNSNDENNFKITYHLESGKQYYLKINRASTNGYVDYTLCFKFVKDFLNVDISPKGATWINESFDLNNQESRVQNLVFIDKDDALKWQQKLQQESFISTLKTLASQNVDSIIEELILQGFSATFAYNMADTIIKLMEVLQPSFKLSEFKQAYSKYEENNFKGFIYSQCYLLRQINGDFTPIQYYDYYDNNTYMYGYPYMRGCFAYN